MKVWLVIGQGVKGIFRLQTGAGALTMRDLHGRERQDAPVIGEEGLSVAPRSGSIKEIANSEGDSVDSLVWIIYGFLS